MNLLKEVEMRLKKHFEKPELTIDFSDGKHMSLEISSAEFKGLGLVDQHKLVYAAVQDLIDSGNLHALKIKTIAK